jgi:hypothetical protein
MKFLYNHEDPDVVNNASYYCNALLEAETGEIELMDLFLDTGENLKYLSTLCEDLTGPIMNNGMARLY